MAPKKETSLADRFNKVRNQAQEDDQMARLQTMSFQQLQDRTIQFGKSKVGMPFHEVVHTDPGYCQWFLRSWGDSKKPEHVEFLYYLRLYIEKMEATSGTEEEVQTPRPEVLRSQGKLSMPKAKAKTSPSTASWEAIEKEEEDLEERVMMHSRMDQMEHVLSQIVQQLQHLTVQSQSSAYPQPQ